MTVARNPTRRAFLEGAAVAPLAALLASPRLARATAEALETVTLTTDDGLSVGAVLAMPARVPAPAILLVHEWWGLNDQIKTVAAELAREGYLALAVDLYGGKVADKGAEARQLMSEVKSDQAHDTLGSWILWLRAHDAASGPIGTVGWCFGGGWSLKAGIGSPVDATVVYYGRVSSPADQLARLQGPVLGHFATRDRFIDKDMVGAFEKRMTELGKAYTSHWYEADHAFANPTSARYDAPDAALAWDRTLAFFRANLGS